MPRLDEYEYNSRRMLLKIVAQTIRDMDLAALLDEALTRSDADTVRLARAAQAMADALMDGQ